MPRLTRRKFAQIISTAGLAGTALLERMYGEMQDGAISSETVQSFLALAGMKVREDQVASVQVSLERAIDSMKRIRDRPIVQSREPAVAFRVRR
jgi:hypothetical protein